MREVHDNLIRFGEVYRSLAFRYVDQIDPEAAMTAAIHGLNLEDLFVELVSGEHVERGGTVV